METLTYIKTVHKFLMDAMYHNVNIHQLSDELFREYCHILIYQNATPHFHLHKDRWFVVPLPK